MEFKHTPIIYSNNTVKSADASLLENRNKTMAYQIMNSHNVKEDEKQFHLIFDKLISHDITYVGIIQSARASGMEQFPMPYALTNCHNSLCAVGGTINEDDHIFGYSAAQKYGGIYVPANQAVIHQYAREQLAEVGKMILGSDSHTRYGAYGCMGVGEGGPELVKQLLKNTYDIAKPEVVLIHVTGKLQHGVGPHDVALVLCKLLFGSVKNCILEFAGEGVATLSNDERIGIDVMTTETGCLSSIWQTDEATRSFYKNHQREQYYKQLAPIEDAYYDGVVELNLSEIECMIALPFHPSNAYPIKEVVKNPHKYLGPIGLGNKIVDNKIMIDQFVVAGCSGGLYENIEEVNAILATSENPKSVMVYPSSTPINFAMSKNGLLAELLENNAVVKPCFCGPCFGAGDVPGNECFSIRHTTRNFPNREGSKPNEGQKSYVGLMDARSIAASAALGYLAAASEVDYKVEKKDYVFNPGIYKKSVYNGLDNPMNVDLIMGPNITDWPTVEPLKDNLLIKLTAVINDAVTTTDELIPSGETSSYRSNPLRLAEFALSRREPKYVERCKQAAKEDITKLGYDTDTTSFGSAIYANKPGDGSAREQAASCQRVLGGCANIAKEYATKRYRSNCINWGMIPFTVDELDGEVGDYVYIEGIKKAIEEGKEEITGVISGKEIKLYFKGLNQQEREILLAGNLMNYYRDKKEC